MLVVIHNLFFISELPIHHINRFYYIFCNCCVENIPVVEEEMENFRMCCYLNFLHFKHLVLGAQFIWFPQ